MRKTSSQSHLHAALVLILIWAVQQEIPAFPGARLNHTLLCLRCPLQQAGTLSMLFKVTAPLISEHLKQ